MISLYWLIAAGLIVVFAAMLACRTASWFFERLERYL